MNLEPLTFQRLRVRSVVVTLPRPIINRLRAIERWPLVLIDLYTAEGIVGRSYLQPYVAKAMPYVHALLNDFSNLLSGQRLSPYDFFQASRKSLAPVGGQGLSMIAASGLDMAAWDALAKAANLPLCALLGGSVGSVAAYNSNGLWLNAPSAVAAEALELIDEGAFTALKLRLGRERHKDDLHTLQAVQQAIGDDVQLMVDYSQALDTAEAWSRCHQLDDHGLAWIEEPIAQDNLDGYAQLRNELKTPIQLGENFYGARDLYRAIQRNACDLVMPDFMRIGGITGWLQAASIAGAAGVPISTHLYPEVAAHVLRVADSAHWLEWQDWANPILREPFPIKDGRIEIPEVAGIGLEWDEAFVATHLAE